MLRVADRIAMGMSPRYGGGALEQLHSGIRSKLLGTLCPVIVADSVAAEMKLGEFVDNEVRKMPGLASPSQQFLIEFHGPTTGFQWAMFVSETMSPKGVPEGGRVTDGPVLFTYPIAVIGGVPVCQPWATIVELTQDRHAAYDTISVRSIVPHNQPPDFLSHATSLLYVVLKTLALLGCANVELQDCTESVGQSAKWHRRTKTPRIHFKTLVLNPLGQRSHPVASDDPQPAMRSLHFCRGHFARYGDDAPLFGKYTGTFWRPSHVRGDLKHGAVVKDYSIKV